MAFVQKGPLYVFVPITTRLIRLCIVPRTRLRKALLTRLCIAPLYHTFLCQMICIGLLFVFSAEPIQRARASGGREPL